MVPAEPVRPQDFSWKPQLSPIVSYWMASSLGCALCEFKVDFVRYKADPRVTSLSIGFAEDPLNVKENFS